jgi:hypothetical protein
VFESGKGGNGPRRPLIPSQTFALTRQGQQAAPALCDHSSLSLYGRCPPEHALTDELSFVIPIRFNIR